MKRIYSQKLMHICKSPYMFVFLKQYYLESLAFLIPRILELFNRKVRKMFVYIIPEQQNMLTRSLLFKKFTNFTSNNSTILRIINEKFSGYYFYMSRNIQRYFQSCIRQCTFKVKQKSRGVFRTQLNIYLSFLPKTIFSHFGKKFPLQMFDCVQNTHLEIPPL